MCGVVTHLLDNWTIKAIHGLHFIFETFGGRGWSGTFGTWTSSPDWAAGTRHVLAETNGTSQAGVNA